MDGKEKEESYIIPAKMFNGIVNILASMPYRDIAPVMKEISDVIRPQVKLDKGQN